MSTNTSTYLYPNYLIAAKRKLKACDLLISKCIGLTEEEEKCICHELYYLSGYIIEGFCVYSIYKILGWEDKETPINGKDEYGKDEYKHEYDVFAERNAISYFGSGWTSNGTKIVAIHNHIYNNYVDRIRKTHKFDGLPYFSSARFDKNEVDSLVKEWTPNIRYDYNKNSNANLSNIKSIIDWCKKIYSHIITNIG